MKFKHYHGLPSYEITPHVAKNIKWLMKREDINVAMLADFCEIPRTTLDHVLKTPQTISSTTCLQKVAEVMRTTVEWLQEGHDEDA